MPNLTGKQNLVLERPLFHTDNAVNFVKNKSNSIALSATKKKMKNPDKENKVNEKNLIVNYILNEGSGTNVADSGSLGINLTSQPNSWDSSSFDKTVFNLMADSNKYITIANEVNDNIKKLNNYFKKSFTISYWAKYDASENGIIFSFFKDGVVDKLNLGINSSDKIVFQFSNSDVLATKIPVDVNITDWNYYTFSFDKRKKQRSIYINGKKIRIDRSGALKVRFPDKSFIGYDGSNVAEAFIYDFRLYNKALKNKKIRRIYKKTNIQGSEGLSKKNLRFHLLLNEGTGTIAKDKTGYGTTGTLNNTPSWRPASSPFGEASLHFDGTNQNISTSNINSGSGGLEISTEITVSLWARSDTSTWNDLGCHVSKRKSFIMHPNSGGKSYDFVINTDGGIFSNKILTYNAPPDITGWHQYVGTYDGVYMKLYYDGIEVASKEQTGGINNDTGKIYVGSDDLLEFGRYYQGSLSDIRIYNVALSQDQINTIYSSNTTLNKKIQNFTGSKAASNRIFYSRQGHCDQNGEIISHQLPTSYESLVMHLKLDDFHESIKVNEKSIILDSSGNNFNGELISFTEGSEWTTNDGPNGGPCLNFDFNFSIDYITLNTELKKYLHGPTEFTISLWVKFNTLSTLIYLFSAREDFNDNKHIYISKTSGNKITFGFHNNDLTSDSTLTNTKWHHITVTYEVNRSRKIYLDGILDKSDTSSNNLDLNAMVEVLIGKRSDNSAYFEGKMSDFRIYDRALTADEVGKIYAETYYPNNYSAEYLDKLNPLDLSTNFGLQYHFTAQDNSSAGYVTDMSGNMRHADVEGVTYDNTESNILVSGKSYSLAFDGSNDYLKLDGSQNNGVAYTGIGGASPMTFLCWIKRGGSGDRCIVSGDSNKLKIVLNSDNKIQVYIDSDKYIIFNDVIGTSKTHLAIMFDTENRINTLKDSCKLFINGSKTYISNEKNSNNEIKVANTTNIHIGSTSTPDTYFQGNMDDIRLYNRALSETEIKIIYGSGGNGTYENIAPKESTIARYDFTKGNYTTAFDYSANSKDMTLSLNNTGDLNLYLPLNEGTGTTANDKAGNSFNGTFQNSPTWLSSGGPYGGACLDFDGTDDSLLVSSLNTGSGGLEITTAMTVSCWAKSDTSNWNNSGNLVSKRNSFILHPIIDTKIIGFYIDDGNGNKWGTNNVQYTITDDITDWHFYTGIYDGTLLKIYVDGMLKATASSTSITIGNDAGGQLHIGRNDGVARYYNGKISDVRIYNRALLPDEIQNLYHLENTHYLSTESNLGLYSLPLDGRGIHGTITSLTNQNTVALDVSVKPEANFIGEEWSFDFTGGAQEDIWTTTKDHGLSVGDKIRFVRDGGGAVGYSVGVDYYVKNVDSLSTLRLSTSSGGDVKAGTSDSASSWQAIKVSEVIIGTKTSSSDLINGDIQLELERSSLNYIHPVAVWKLDEGTGSTVTDISGNENNATLQNDPTWSATGGPYGNTCIDFDGSDEHIITSSINTGSGGLNITTEITVSLWAKASGSTWNDQGCHVSKRRSFIMHPNKPFFGGGTKSYSFVVNKDGGLSSNIFATALDSDIPDVSNWHHYVGTFDGLTMRLYYDGVQVASNDETGGINNDNGVIYIGRDDNDAGVSERLYNGSLSDVRIYNRALSAEAISQLFYRTQDTNIPKILHYEANLVGYWKLNENDGGTLAYDSSVNKNNGLLTNGPTWKSNAGPYAGACLDFDGTNDYISLPNASKTVFHQSSFTLSTWVNFDNITGDKFFFEARNTDSSGANQWLHIGKSSSGDDTKIKMSFSGDTDFLSNSSMSINKWFYVTCVFQIGAGRNIYINGTLDNSDNHTTALTMNDTTSGYINIGIYSTHELDGKLSDFRIYNRALNAQEIADIYNYTGYRFKANVKIGGSLTSLYSSFISFSTWNEASIVYRSGEFLQLYVNGKLVGKNKLSTSQSLLFSNNLSIGCRELSSSKDSFFKGKISDIKIYNTILKEKDIKKLVARANDYILRLQPYNPKNTKVDSTSLMDLSGNHNIIMTNFGTSFDISESILGRKVVFDGSDDYLQITSGDLKTKVHRTFTITGWIKPSSNDSGTGNIIFHKYHHSTASQKYYKIVYDDDNSEIDFVVYSNGADKTVSGNISQDTWSYITCVCEGAYKNIRLYINGKLITSTQINSILNSGEQNIEFGRDTNNSNFYNGEICDFRFYDSILSSDMIEDLMNEGISSKIVNIKKNITFTEEPVLTDGIKAHYNGMGNSYSALDNSGQGNYGVMYPYGTGTSKFDTGKYNAALHFDGTDDMILIKGDSTDSLVGRWLLNESSGSSVNDISDFNHNGSLNNDPSWSSDGGPYGNVCLDFDGTNDYVSISYTEDSVLDFSDNSSRITIMLWVKMDSATQPEDILIEAGNGNGWRFYAEPYNGNSGGNWGFRVKGDHSSPSTEHQANTALGTNTWYHLAVTYDKSNIKFYLNGVADGSVSETSQFDNITTRVIHFARGIGGAQRFPNCKMSDVRIYNIVLTVDEIYDIYSHTVKSNLYNDFAISMWTKFDNLNDQEGVLSLYNTNGVSDVNKNMYIYKKCINSQNQWFFNFSGENFSVSVDPSTDWNHITFIQGYGSDDVYDGLVGHWKLNEQSGTTGYDSSENNNNGTLTGGPTHQSTGGPVTTALPSGGPCLDFDGSNDYIDLPTSLGSYFDGSVEFTISLWAKPDAVSTSEYLFSARETFDQNKHLHIYKLNTNKIRMGFHSNDLDSNGTIDTNWHHITITYETGSVRKIYLDGVLDISDVSSSNLDLSSTAEVLIGMRSNRADDTFNGKMSDFRIYNRALSSKEIKRIYNNKLKDFKTTKAIFYNGELLSSSGLNDENNAIKEPFFIDTNALKLGESAVESGTATATGASTIDLDNSASSVNDHYNTLTITIVGGTGDGQSRTISDYVGSSRRVTVSSNWDPAIDTTSMYVINKPFFLSGLIDDFRLYNRALTLDEAQLLYNNSQGVVNRLQNTNEIKSTLYASNYLVTNTNKASNPLPKIARDNLIIHYDFTKTTIDGVRDVNFRSKPVNLYSNSKILNISGKKQMRKNVFDGSFDRNQNWTFTASSNKWASSVVHSLAVNDTITFITDGGGASGYSTGTTYYVKTVESLTEITLSASQGGSVVNGTSDSTGNWKITNITIEDGEEATSLRKVADFDGKHDFITIDTKTTGGTWSYGHTTSETINGVAYTHLWTTTSDHNLIPGDVINFTATGNAVTNYSANTNYFVRTTPSSTKCQLSLLNGGDVLEGNQTSSGTWTAKHVPLLMGSNNWTVSVWIKPSELTENMTIWLNSNNNGNQKNKRLYIDKFEKSSIKFQYFDADILESNCEAKLNEWNHIVVTSYQYIVSSGQVVEATNVNITLKSTDMAENSYYSNNSMFIIITGGTGEGQVREITSYTKSSKVATISSGSDNWTQNPDNTSTYIIVTNMLSLYVDGNLKARTFDTMKDTTTGSIFRIGANKEGFENFKGKMADFRVYDTQLNDTEIKRLYNHQPTIGPLIHYTFEEGEGDICRDLGSSGANMRLVGATFNTDEVNVGTKCLKIENFNDSGLVVHWLLNEGEGTTVEDISSNSNNGTFGGAPTWLSNSGPDNGTTLDFDGSDDKLSISSINTGSGGLEITDKMTVSVWVKSNTSEWSASGSIVSKRHSFILHPSRTTKTISFRKYTGGSNVEGKAEFTPSEEITDWHLYTGTYDGSNVKIYFDGDLKASTSSTGTVNNDAGGTIQFAVDDFNGSRYFNGKMSDVRIYNRALSDDEITNLYNKSQFCKININSVIGNYHYIKPFSISMWFKKKYYNTSGTLYEFGHANSSQFRLFIDSSDHHIYAYAGNSSNVIKTRYNTNTETFVTGSVSSAGSNTVTLDGNASTTASFYNENTITITSGTGVGQSRLINAYTNSKVATVSEAWDTQPDDKSTYMIGTSATTDWTNVTVVVLPTNNHSSTIQNIRIFVNGEDKTVYTTSTTFYNTLIDTHSEYKFTIGCNNNSDRGNYFDGFIDDFRMYNVSLTPNEIVELYFNKFNYSKM